MKTILSLLTLAALSTSAAFAGGEACKKCCSEKGKTCAECCKDEKKSCADCCKEK